MKLFKTQRNAIYYLNHPDIREVVYGGAAGGGKSALLCLRAIEMAQKYKGSRWMLGRSKLKTLKQTTLNTFFEVASAHDVDNQFTFNHQSNTIHFKNGSDILLKDLFYYPSDPEFDELGSLEICGAFVDEVSGHLEGVADFSVKMPIQAARVRHNSQDIRHVQPMEGLG